jgi:molybdenum cofactor synthesis domain-containing protein
MAERSCALVVIGNEILSGKVQDSNAYFAARELRRVGVSLERITVIPDDLDAIAREVRYCSDGFEIVLTSGGIGPTHDDLTMDGVAAAFGRRVAPNQELISQITEHSPGGTNPARLKMANIPEGSVLVRTDDIWFPTVQVENVYILPGVPQLFETKLKALANRFATDPFYIRIIYTSAAESAIAHDLNQVLARFPRLMLGSYPRFDDPGYRVRLTLESKDRNYLESAFQHLLDLLPADIVIRTE